MSNAVRKSVTVLVLLVLAGLAAKLIPGTPGLVVAFVLILLIGPAAAGSWRDKRRS